MQRLNERSPARMAVRGEADYSNAQDQFIASDPLSAFINAMQDAGLTPTNPGEITGDGNLHRFHIEGDRKADRNGWCVLHLDGRPAGAFGSWKAGISGHWCADRHTPVTDAERKAIAQARREREAQQERERLQAADRALRILNESSRANPAHPYLIDKRVRPHKAREYGGRLVLPLFDFDANLHSLQFIGPDGEKKLLRGGRKRGCFIPVNGRMPAARVLICEGWATGATLAESEPDALVLAAVDAHNLQAVATGARQKWPEVEIVICGDCDAVGEAKARQAAKSARALVAFPDFPANAQGSDFNDLAAIA